MIENYSFGKMVINGQTFTSDLVISSSGIHPSWWRKNSHRVEIEDIEAFIFDNTEQLVLGHGVPGRMFASENLRAYLKAKNILLMEEPTPAAVEVVNSLLAGKVPFAAGFHLTC